MKGPKEIFNPQTKEYFVGIKEHRFGVEGLIKNVEDFKKVIRGKVVFERPNLEDIMFYFTRGKRYV
ncbi:MAG: type transport system ATP-binding protein [Tepidanaerobacteraceae bacterium]|nr:type transport system ATP-binding protein [Tepidanaerobacteraceae bacterium]